MQWQTEHFYAKKLNKKQFIVNLFVALFFIAQINSLSHQIKHVTDPSENICLQCIATADVLADTTTSTYVVTQISDYHYLSNLTQAIQPEFQSHYSPRAPPYC
jgi:hypothetical protein